MELIQTKRAGDLPVRLPHGITKSYQLTEGATKQNHFAEIRYGLTKMIRLFVLDGPPRHLIPANVICAAMLKVVAMDA
jgi:hypothetical protein